MTISRQSKQQGAINNQLLVIIGLLVLVVAMSGLSGWLYLQYDEQRTDVNSKIAVAEAAARKVQAEEDESKVKAIEEEPNREFAGPENFGRLSFKYPKNWSVYIEDDASSVNASKFSAYLHPVIVPPIDSRAARFALTVDIDSFAYERALDKYKSGIQRGDLKSSPITVNGHEGTRLDGNLAQDIRGSVALFRVRDKTITISSQAETFKEYFDTIIQSVDFND